MVSVEILSSAAVIKILYGVFSSKFCTRFAGDTKSSFLPSSRLMGFPVPGIQVYFWRGSSLLIGNDHMGQQSM